MDGSALPVGGAAAPVGRADGVLVAVADRRGGATRLARLYQRQPLRGFTPRPAAGEPLTLVLANLSGGMVSGDRYRTTVTAAAGADLLVCGQAAEKVYRAAGSETVARVALSVADGAVLEWLPQGTILFDGARLDRMTTADLASDGRLLAGELLVLGRIGRGEVMRRGRLDEHWRLRVGGRLVWADALRLDGEIGATLDHPAAFGGARSLATALYAAPGAGDLLDAARQRLAALGDGGGGVVRAAATALPGVLLVRLLGADPAAVRRLFGRFWAWLRVAALGRPARLPVLWHI